MKHKTLPYACMSQHSDIKHFHASSFYGFLYNDIHTFTNIATFYDAFETLYGKIWSEILITK